MCVSCSRRAEHKVQDEVLSALSLLYLYHVSQGHPRLCRQEWLFCFLLWMIWQVYRVLLSRSHQTQYQRELFKAWTQVAVESPNFSFPSCCAPTAASITAWEQGKQLHGLGGYLQKHTGC
jgi:hypothetical protein